MTTHILAHRTGAALRRRSVPMRSVVQFALEHYLVLPIGAAVALAWANTRPEGY
jgi:hypothetical protein